MDIVLFEEFGAGEMALDIKDQLARNELLKDESYRRKFRRFYKEKLSPRVWQRDFGDAVILDCPDASLVGRDFASVARERGIHVVDLFLDMVVEHGKALRWSTVVGNHRQPVLSRMVQNPNTLITFSDAGAHIRNMAFYNLPLRFLKLVRDSEQRGQAIMSVERAVHRLTGEQADWLGVEAGRIRPGDRADIVLLDPAGLELATWCDLRVAAETATFGVFCRRFGVPLIDGGTVRLPRLIGMSRAMDMILTGRAVSAEEALQMGLANRLAVTGEALTTAQELAGQLAAFPQACLRNDRLSAYQQWQLDEPQALANEFQHGLRTLHSGETTLGATQFSGGKGRHGEFGG